MMKLPYSEGTVFSVPLSSGGYARGVVARASAVGGLFGYFFGPLLRSDNTAGFSDLNPEKAILRVRFGDLGLINGEWPICGQLGNWDRAQWPMPDFVRRDPLGHKKPIRVRYSNSDPNKIESECSIDDD